MADAIYEYTDAQGGVHQVSDLSQVPKDRLKHMLVIGADEAAASGEAAVAPPPKPPAASMGSMGVQVWGVSAFLLVVGLRSRKFLLQVFCVMTAVLWVIYNSWDLFLASDYSRTAEREVRKKPPVEAEEEP
ncbi:MAG: hypothetical protein HYV15_00815 [Elusimicrobia bacterium]|nr:hypothetical protein [Elusimicrobiota bacterium]